MNRHNLLKVVRRGFLAVVFIGVVALLMAWLAGSFRSKVSHEETGAPVAGRPAGNVRLVDVVIREVPRTETAVGTIRAVHETAVAAKLLARVTEVGIRSGQVVQRGDVLVRLDDTEFVARARQAAASVDRAKALLEQAQLVFDRVSAAFEQQAATQLEIDRARTDLDGARAEVQRAEQAHKEAEAVLADTVIKSPIDGQVIEKHVEVGDTVTPGRVVATLFDPTRMELVASVRETLTQRLEVGGSVNVHIDAIGKTCEGQVSEIVPEADPASRAFTVKVTGPCPAGVYTGMFGRLLIPVGSESVTLIPVEAVRRVGQLDLVEVAAGDRLYRRSVELGRSFDNEIEVLSGLRPGERVAVNSRDEGTTP